MAGDLLDRLRPRPDRRKVGEDERDWAPPPPDASWRARRRGWPRALAWVGIGAGFVLMVVPGIAARRGYLAWRAGERPGARLAWGLGVVALWTGAVALLWTTAMFGAGLALGIVLLPALVYPVVRP